MEDFFKQFRDNLERRPPPSFEERDWQDLNKRLGQEDKKRPVILTWRSLALPLLLLSLGANVLLYGELSILRQRDVAFEMRRDTVFQTNVVLKTDTIFRTRFVRDETVPPSAFNTFAKSDLPTPVFSPGVYDASRQYDASSPVSQMKKPDVGLAENPVILFESPASLPHRSPYPVPTPQPSLPEIPVEPASSKQKKTIQHHLYAMRPKGFHLGAAGGWAHSFSEGLDGQGGFSAGLESAVEFSPALRMWMGATFYKTGITANRMNEAVGIPVVVPPADDFTFVEAEAKQPSLEYGIGMQYMFSAASRFRPFLGVGYGAVALLPYEVVYDFENQHLGIEWSFEKNVSRSEFLASHLLLRAGFEYEMSRYWYWQLRATYRTHLDDADFQSPDILGFQAGLMRRF